MATYKRNGFALARHGAWMALVLAILFLCVRGTSAQEEPASPLRTQQTLQQAIKLYKDKDYEKAAQYFAYVQPMQQSLTPTDQSDFTKFNSANSIALKGRQDGGAQIRLAEDAIKQNRLQDAGNLLKSLTNNQYLAPAEQAQVAELNKTLQAQSSAAVQGKTDAKSLLAAGRNALQAGDLATAKEMANRADKASSLMPAWMQPWSDSPAKLRRDIQTAEVKVAPPPPAPTPKGPELMPKNPEPVTTSKFGGLWPFGGSSSPTPAKKEQAASDRRVDEKIARQVVSDGYLFLQANDLDKAQFMATKAKELNATWGPDERTPDMLMQEIQQRKGIAVTPIEAPKILPKELPKDLTKEQPKEELPPPNADARALLKFGRTMLEKKKYDDAEKACSKAQSANARWGLFEDTPDKLRKDIQRLRASYDRDESFKLMADARKLLTQGALEEAEKKAYKAKQLHGPYGVFDFGDRPDKLIEEIGKAKLTRGPVNLPDKKDPLLVRDNSFKAGIPFESPKITGENKNRAIMMVGQARELERRGMLTDARQKALEARSLNAAFTPDEDSPDNVLLGLSARCDKQIVAHLQQAVQHAADPNDAQRFEKAQIQLLQARKLAQAFQMDSGRIEQAAYHVQQVATGSKSVQQVSHDLVARPVDPSTGDPKLDQARKLAREKLQQAQLELSYGKTAQARKMAEEVFNADPALQKDALALIRSISAEEYNQQILEAKRNFDAGLDAFLQKDFKKAIFVFQSIDTAMLPEPYQVRYRDIMSTREMQQPIMLTQGERINLKSEKIIETRPTGEPNRNTEKPSLLDEHKARDLLQYQALRQHGLEAMRTAHDMYKNNQKEEAIAKLKHYIEQVEIAQLDPQKSNELKRLPDARIQQYRTMMAEEKLKGIEKTSGFTTKFDEADRQRKIKMRQDEIAERMKVVTEQLRNNKLEEAVLELKKLREIDPDNLAVLAGLNIATVKINQQKYDADTHGNEDIFVKGLSTNLSPGPGRMVFDIDDPIKFDKKRLQKGEKSNGALPHDLSDPKERAIEYRLRQPISLNFKDLPLEQAVKDLSLMSGGVQVQLDYAALDDAKINLQSPLSISVDNVDMKSALNLMLNRLKLAYTIENQCLMITTPERTKGRFKRVTYPIGDLIVAVPDHPLPDVLNIQKAIERSMQPNGFGSSYLTPPPYAFSPGTPVSSHGDGLGGAFGGQNGRQGSQGSQLTPSKDRSKEAMAEILKELIQNTVAKESWETMGGKGNIQYFPFGMALVISQPQEVQEEVALLLATLRRLQDLQVSVELRAVLVSETFFERIGVDFDMNIRTPTSRREPDLVAGNFVPAPFINRSGAGLGGLISGLTSAGSLTPDLNIPIRNSTFNFTTPQFGGYQPEAGLTLGLAFLSDIQVFMFLEAVQGDRRAHIMQAPKLTVFNGQIATIGGLMVRPSVTGVIPAALGNGQLVMIPQITQIPFGLTMTVQPVVSPDRRFIRLNVTPQLTAGIQDPAGAIVIAVPGSVPATFDGGGVQPFFANNPLSVTINPSQANLQIANTTVNVPDGGTVLLGGFKFLAEERTEYGPPILSKIPYISRLFRNVGWSRDGSTLIYLVTARVIMVEEEERLLLGEIPPFPGR